MSLSKSITKLRRLLCSTKDREVTDKGPQYVAQTVDIIELSKGSDISAEHIDWSFGAQYALIVQSPILMRTDEAARCKAGAETGKTLETPDSLATSMDNKYHTQQYPLKSILADSGMMLEKSSNSELMDVSRPARNSQRKKITKATYNVCPPLTPLWETYRDGSPSPMRSPVLTPQSQPDTCTSNSSRTEPREMIPPLWKTKLDSNSAQVRRCNPIPEVDDLIDVSCVPEAVSSSLVQERRVPDSAITKLETRAGKFRVHFSDTPCVSITYGPDYDRSPCERAVVSTCRERTHMYVQLMTFKMTEMPMHTQSIQNVNFHLRGLARDERDKIFQMLIRIVQKNITIEGSAAGGFAPSMKSVESTDF